MTSDTVVFGRVVCTYQVQDRALGGSRLVAKLLCRADGRLVPGSSCRLLPAGDLVMMRASSST